MFSFISSMRINNVCSDLVSYPFSFISSKCYYNSDVSSDVVSCALELAACFSKQFIA